MICATLLRLSLRPTCRERGAVDCTWPQTTSRVPYECEKIVLPSHLETSVIRPSCQRRNILVIFGRFSDIFMLLLPVWMKSSLGFDTLIDLRCSLFFSCRSFDAPFNPLAPKSGTHGWENNLSAGPRNTSQQAEELLATRDSLWNGVEDALAYITPLRVAQAILLSHIWVITCELHSIWTKLTLQIPALPTVSPLSNPKERADAKSQTLLSQRTQNIMSLAHLSGRTYAHKIQQTSVRRQLC